MQLAQPDAYAAAAQPGRTGRNGMAAKAVILLAIAVAIAPAAAAVFWPSPDNTALTRAVQISGPIAGFTQSHDRIQVRLTPAASNSERDARSQVIVTDAEGDQFTIPLKRGQTWASAELPHNLADAASLNISVE
jgi:hypothetical protein